MTRPYHKVLGTFHIGTQGLGCDHALLRQLESEDLSRFVGECSALVRGIMMKKKDEMAAITQTIKSSIVSAATAKTDVALAISNCIAEVLARTIGTAGYTGREVTAITVTVASAAISGALQCGCDLSPAMQGLVVSILRGTRLIGSEVLDAITRTAVIAIKAVAESEGNLEGAATGLVRGAIQGANEIGVNTEKAASAAAVGALNAVGDVRSTAYQAVLAAVTKPIDGITVAPKEPAVSSN